MSDPVTTAVAIVTMLDKMGGWQLGTTLAAVALVPPVLAFVAARTVAKVISSLELRIVESDAKTAKLFTAMSTKYENNLEFVKNYEKLVRNHQALSDALLEVIRQNTQAQTLVAARLEQGARHDRA